MNETLTAHRINNMNRDIVIDPIGEPGPGGAHFGYRVTYTDASGKVIEQIVSFQNGDPAVAGRTGLTNEVWLAILIHRLQGFQAGPFKCRENAVALTHLEEALMWLQKRTRDRIDRGVEGKTVA